MSSLFKFRRAIEALVTPSTPKDNESRDWEAVDEIRVRIAGHEVVISSDKNGLVMEYALKSGRKAPSMSSSITPTGLKVVVTP